MSRRSKPPTYRYHKARNCAVVTIHGKNYYLGEFGSPESKQLYAQLITEKWADALPPDIPAIGASVALVDDLIARYMTKHVVNFYVDRDGKPSERQCHIRLALRPLHELFGQTPVNTFGPKRLKLVRERLISLGQEKMERGYARNYLNNLTAIAVNLFRWGVEEELVPVEIYQALLAVQPLAKGRESRVKESAKVSKVDVEIVMKTLPFLPPQLATMVQLQLHTAMRPDEVTIIRQCDIDQTDEVWIYTPCEHKTEHHDIDRVVYFGPKCQELLKPWFDRPDDHYLFSPKEVVAAIRARRRKTPLEKPERFNYDRAPRDHYDDESYCRAIKRACLRAGVPKWTPNQIRHEVATSVRKTYGLEASKLICGHKSAVTTESHYAERDMDIVVNIMKEIG